MIACINPSHNCADHSINTLRYADRLNEREKCELTLDFNQTMDDFDN